MIDRDGTAPSVPRNQEMPVLFRRFSTLLVSAITLAGCASSSRNIPAYDETASVRPVEVFVTTRPTRPYVDRGIIEVRQRNAAFPHATEAETTDEALNRMSRQAAARGCDAVILVDSTTTVSGVIVEGGGRINSNKGLRGSCVVYSAAETAPAAAPAQQCVPNVTQLCHGPGACEGAQACVADGTGFTPCDCGEAARSLPASTGSGPAEASPASAPAVANPQTSTAAR
jgi:hypothetical protein